MNLCQACQIGSHDHCSGQVRAANMPCSCEHCWGPGGSEAAYKRIADAQSPKYQEDTPVFTPAEGK